jgi:outer membrane protein assembly factor BamB
MTFWRAPMLATLLLAAAGTIPLAADDWPRFRGPSGAGIAAAAALPSELNPETNLRWKVASGKGASSPVIVGSRVFLTAFEGDDRLVKCFDANSGAVLWEQSIHAERTEVATAPGGAANPTPAADESSVYVFFPDLGLRCFTHDGQPRWQVALGPFYSFHGVTASLVLAEAKVIVLVDQLQDSFLAAFDCQTGAEVWKVARHDGPIGGYSTPATRLTAAGKTELVVSGPLEVVGYDAATGNRTWSIDGVTNAPISVPVVGDSQVFVCEPSFSQNPFKIDSLLVHDKNKDGELSLEELESQVPLYRIAKRIDQGWGNGDGKVSAEELEKAFRSFVGGGGLAAIELAHSNGTTAAQASWTYRKSVPQIPSLLFFNRVLFFINDGGILTSLDPTSGKILKQARLNHGAKFYASPVAAAGKLLLIDTEGKIAIATAEADWKIVSTTQLDQRCYTTPAIAAGSVYIRGETDLFCFRAAD